MKSPKRKSPPKQSSPILNPHPNPFSRSSTNYNNLPHVHTHPIGMMGQNKNMHIIDKRQQSNTNININRDTNINTNRDKDRDRDRDRNMSNTTKNLLQTYTNNIQNSIISTILKNNDNTIQRLDNIGNIGNIGIGNISHIGHKDIQLQQQIKYKHRIDELTKDNIKYKQHIKILNQQNLVLTQKNRILEKHIQQIIGQLNLYYYYQQQGRKQQKYQKYHRHYNENNDNNNQRLNINMQIQRQHQQQQLYTVPTIQLTTFRRNVQNINNNNNISNMNTNTNTNSNINTNTIKYNTRIITQPNIPHIQNLSPSSHNNKSKYKNNQYKYQLLKKLVENLQAQNLLLINFKTSSLKQIKQLKSQIQIIYNNYNKQKQDNIRKTYKLQQQYKIHLEDNKNMNKLQILLKQTNQQLNDIIKQVKIKDQDMKDMHIKFHKQMEKMKDRVQRYKNKADNYRRQRDQLALQMQRAKLEIGAVTLRKYFPQDSDD